jgi:hypothetical protein
MTQLRAAIVLSIVLVVLGMIRSDARRGGGLAGCINGATH